MSAGHNWQQFEHPVDYEQDGPQPYWICKKCNAVVSGYDKSGIWNTVAPDPQKKMCPLLEPPTASRYMTCEELQVQRVQES
jgi:hypothetical protein